MNIEKMALAEGDTVPRQIWVYASTNQHFDDLHFGMTRQCPLAIGPISMNAKIVSVSNSFILHHEHPAIHS